MSTVATVSPRLATSPKRAAIIKSAIAEFLEHGFERASIEDIAQRAGVAKQTIYAHFSSKAGLIEVIDRDYVVWPDDIVDFAYDPGASLKAQLTRIGRAILTVFTSDAFVVVQRVRIARWVESPDVSGPTVTTQGELFNASLRAWVQAATRDRRLMATNARLAADEFMALLIGPFLDVLLGQRPRSRRQLNELLGSAVRMFLNTYDAKGLQDERR